MIAQGNVTRTEALVGGYVTTALALHGKLKTEASRIELHPEEFEPFPPCPKIVRVLGRVKLRLLCVEQAVKHVRLSLLRNTYSCVSNVNPDPVLLFLDSNRDEPAIGRVLDCIFQKALNDLAHDARVHVDVEIALPLYTELHMPVGCPLPGLLHSELSEGIQVDRLK